MRISGSPGSTRVTTLRSFSLCSVRIKAEPTWRSFETPAELLGRSVGAQLRRQGGRDDFSTLTIRGAPSAQLRVLLDGVALGRASSSVVNLADLHFKFGSPV